MPSRRSESLSERDKQTLELLAEGLTQREIDERVAKLHDDDLDVNAVRWSECCDFREARWSIADVRELLHRIVDLARSARSQQSLLHIRPAVWLVPQIT